MARVDTLLRSARLGIETEKTMRAPPASGYGEEDRRTQSQEGSTAVLFSGALIILHTRVHQVHYHPP